MRASDYSFFDAPFLAFAHRGGATYAPNLRRENTRHAFSQAVALGYRYLETDVHATTDGVLVAFHDTVLDRVTDRRGAIAELTYSDVQAARIGGQDAIPTLAELFEAFPEARFNIDAKSAGAVELLARTVAEHDAHHRVCVSSFSIRRLYRLRRLLGPRVPAAASSIGIAWNRFFPWLTWALDTPAPALQIPLDRRIFGARLEVCTDALLAAAHRRGKQVHVWTVDGAAEIEALIDRGVDGIFTDRVDTLKTVLAARGLWADAP